MKLPLFYGFRRLATSYRVYALRRRISGSSQPRRLVIGAGGKKRYEGWEHTDMAILDILKREDWLRLGPADYFDAILAEHVWEHLTPEAGLQGACLCREFLKPGGHLRIAVPDGGNPDSDYIERVRPGGYGPGSHDHKVLYDYRSLSTLLTKAGLEPRLLEYYDERGTLHTSDWSNDDGPVRRTSRRDLRTANGAVRSSLLIDGCKAGSSSKS
jgi:predicted SAM-dependent methyltransferase